MIKLVIFDLDDTLYPEYTFVHEGFKAVCRYLSIKYSVSSEMLFEETLDLLRLVGRGKIFDRLCEKYNLNEDISNLVEIYRNVKPNISLYKESEYVISELKRRGIFVGVITDGKASVQWNKISALNLDIMVDKIIVTDDYGKENWKPSTYCFKLMLNYFKLTPKESIYVGDNPNKDFLPCKKLGMKSIRLIGTDSEYKNVILDEIMEADIRLDCMEEIFDLDIMSEFRGSC
ncbi:HAD family hydrolase [Acetoanaerobium noterae]|uniref:HAD family hydrolase n=1 Tax=Acetoanaerobium noterae TaxID=745369 RepID=UPI00324283C3